MGYTAIYIVVGWNFADNCGKVIFLDGRQPYTCRRTKLIAYYDCNKYGGVWEWDIHISFYFNFCHTYFVRKLAA